MKTFIINLRRSIDRRHYMEEQCKQFPFLNVEYIEAIDGMALSDEEKCKLFDCERFKKKNSTNVRPGEIGCTLSHRKCYRKIVDENIPYVLILEDDTVIYKEHFKEILDWVTVNVNNDIPQIILLSGWYWFTKINQTIDEVKLVRVYNAWLTHSYIINNAAAKLLLENKPDTLADDWYWVRKKGVNLQAILPHVIAQNKKENIVSTVDIGQTSHRSFLWRVKNFKRLAIMKILYYLGHFEEA